MPPVDGMTGNVYFWKTEDGCVIVSLSISKESEFVSWEQIAIMPVGYRPFGYRAFPGAGLYSDDGFIISITEDGKISTSTMPVGITHLASLFTFLASE